MRNTYYWICPYCQSRLDPGESCDCRKEVKPADDHDSPSEQKESSKSIEDTYRMVSGGE